jgi:hypothetical protein
LKVILPEISLVLVLDLPGLVRLDLLNGAVVRFESIAKGDI